MLFAIRLSPDITIKSSTTRRRFVRMLMDNLQDAFRMHGIKASIEDSWARLYVTSDDPNTEEAAAKVFGVLSIARVQEHYDLSLSELVDKAVPYFKPRMQGKTFAVRARCTGPLGFKRSDIAIQLGAALAPFGKVQLVNPQVTCFVEVRDGRIHFFSDMTSGPSGLPLGSEGRAVMLISGGFDSAVAAWMMGRRGVDLSYVFCRLGGSVHTQATLRVIDVLARQWSFGSQPRIYIVPFENIVEDIRTHCRPAYWQLVLKRKMYAVAQEVARRSRAHAIITGESIGQVSSQTLRNLTALEDNLQTPVLRPLLAMDKEEIIRKARHIGTYEISATVQEYCAIQSKKPVVATKRADLRDQEAKLPFDLENTGKQVRILRARKLEDRHFQIDGLEISEIPKNATVLDLRGKMAFKAWHYPGAIALNLQQGLRMLQAFDSQKTYVAYCEIGLKSAHLAEEMQKHGLSAYNFHGGLTPLLRFAASQKLIPAQALEDPSLLS